MKITRTKYTAEFKERALTLIHLGKPMAEVARDLEISANLLYIQRQQSQSTRGSSVGQKAEGELSEADTLLALLQDYARLQAENEILKKAVIILGTKTPSNLAR